MLPFYFTINLQAIYNGATIASEYAYTNMKIIAYMPDFYTCGYLKILIAHDHL
jgi:hypothetical protein